jgi:hypothetical protein
VWATLWDFVDNDAEGFDSMSISAAYLGEIMRGGCQVQWYWGGLPVWMRPQGIDHIAYCLENTGAVNANYRNTYFPRRAPTTQTHLTIGSPSASRAQVQSVWGRNLRGTTTIESFPPAPPSTPGLSAYITGTGPMQNGEYGEWYAHVSGGTGPYVCEWSYDGHEPNQVDNCVSGPYFESFSDGPTYHNIYLVVHDANGGIVNAGDFIVEVHNSGGCEGCGDTAPRPAKHPKSKGRSAITDPRARENRHLRRARDFQERNSTICPGAGGLWDRHQRTDALQLAGHWHGDVDELGVRCRTQGGCADVQLWVRCR